MKIEKIILNNFRNFEHEICLELNDLVAIIGRNDLGKSTILEALDIFINEGDSIIKLDKDDACKRSGKDEFSIAVIFSKFPDEVDIDEGNKTSLEEEYLLNQDKQLEVHKHYKSGKCTGVYIRALHPTATSTKDLLLKKQIELRKIVEDNEYPCDNKRKNASLRKAIRDGIKDLLLDDVFISVNEEGDAKKIWIKLQAYLPVYALFQSDRANKDGDSEIQDPMRLAIKEILQKDVIQAKLNAIATEVENISKEIAEKTLGKLSEMNPDIAKELKPIIPSSKDLRWESVFRNIEISSDYGVPLNKRGSGVRRLVLLNFFRARAEEKVNANEKSNVIYAIEEPETSQHPNHQKILIKALKELAEMDGRQIILTTHSPSLIQLLPKKYVKLLRKTENALEIVSGDLAISEIVDDLGVMPLIGKVAVFIEGETDRQFLLNIGCIRELMLIIDISKLSIIPMRGSTLETWIHRNYLSGSNITEYHLYDKDSDGKYKDAIELVNERGDTSRGVLTRRREIENYIPLALIKANKNFCDIDLSPIQDTWNQEDIPKYLASKTGLSELCVKEVICCSISKNLTKELLDDSGAWEEVKGWFETIRDMVDITRHENS